MRRAVARLVALAGLLALGCANNRGCERSTDRYDRDRVRASLDTEDGNTDAGLVMGVFPLAPNGVVDGDTIKVAGLESSLRLLALDTEETFKSEKDLRLFDEGWEVYLKKKQAETDRPVKCATPMGMEAKEFAAKFFQNVIRVRLERDHPKEIKGRYARYLAYAFVERDGVWVNYNVEAVRAGMSPYFTKYGRSRRFHDEFVAAQQEAREAGRGIWDPDKQHYRDYDKRLSWWNARAEFLEQFEREAKGRDDYITLTHWDALEKLADFEGREVTILGGVGSIKEAKGNAPTRVLLSRRMFSDFPLIFFDEEVVAQSRVEDARGEFLRVRGQISTYRYKGKRKRDQDREQLQIVVRRPEQIQIAETGALAKIDDSQRGDVVYDEPPGPKIPDRAEVEEKGVPGGIDPALGELPGNTAPANPTDAADAEDVPPPPPAPPQ